MSTTRYRIAIYIVVSVFLSKRAEKGREQGAGGGWGWGGAGAEKEKERERGGWSEAITSMRSIKNKIKIKARQLVIMTTHVITS